MKKIIICFFLWLSCSCNNQPSATEETQPTHLSVEKNTGVIDTIDRWKNDPAYKDSLTKVWQQDAEKRYQEKLQKESKYTPELWAQIYKHDLDGNVTIDDFEVKYNANYQPTLYLTISNRGGLTIISMELMAGKYSSLNRNKFKIKQAIPPRGKINVTVEISEDIASLPISVYSAISNTGERFVCREALKATY